MITEAKSPVSGKKAGSAAQSSKAKQRWSGVTKKERSRTMSKVVKQRWEGIAQTEEDLRHYFADVELDQALDTFATMRKHYEIAGKIIDDRIQSERNKEACANCGKEFNKDVPWFNREPVKDPQTGIITNVFTCSQACLIAMKGNQTARHRRF